MLLCSPRGFCAGVVRAIESVERALAIYGAPVYVRHEIVHNRYVVDSLRAKGAIFVEELSEVPNDHAPVIFSAHGVARAIPEEAQPPQSLHDRRDLSAGDQGSSRGGDPLTAAAARLSSSDTPAIRKSSAPWGSCRRGALRSSRRFEDVDEIHAARRQQAGLCHADDAVGRRHGSHGRSFEATFPAHFRSAQGRHLLRDHKSPGCGQARGARGRRHDRRRRSQFRRIRSGSRKWPRNPAARARC